MWRHWVLAALQVLCAFWFYSSKTSDCKRKSSSEREHQAPDLALPDDILTHGCGSQEETHFKKCPNHHPKSRWYVSTKNYFILLWGPLYTQLFISPAPYEPVLQKLSIPKWKCSFPHLSEGATGQDNTMYWEMTGSFQGLHVLRVIGPEDPWLLPGDCPSPPDGSSMKTEEHLPSSLS